MKVLRVVFGVFLLLLVLAGLALILAVALGVGYVAGFLARGLFHLPFWPVTAICTAAAFFAFLGPVLGWWEERRRAWAPTLATLWLFDRFVGRD